ncbi:unnamed protein product [Coffea canephora]|uniref:TF-B3 domain-containing protein n=2 Tax=Coffea TaxID=13442 RepID=A0A068UBK4_COFCA|nr:unnamed protein product [Coffea canephora]
MGSTSTSSSSKISCFQCEETSSSFDHFRNGWRLRSGEFAQLCPRCASIYEEGKFCEAFHSNDDGWRDCESCGKLVHCGCIVSFNAYLLLDFGGVICMECSRINFALARSRCLFLEGQPDITRQTVIEPQYRPRSSEVEVQQISRNFDCVVTPLFEKLLSATDADLKLARLIIPKKCAEAFFPDISEPRGFLLKIQDTEGMDWDFNYRYWINGGSKMYILEGLRDFMISKRWQAGDTVTFYRVEPGGKLVIGLRKTSSL